MKPGYEYLTEERRRNYYKGRYHQLVEMGLCPVCGKNRPAPGVKLCEECRLRNRERERAERMRRALNHQCVRCGAPLPPLATRKTCFSCRVEMCSYHEKKREAGE